ncbi:MAG: protoheme IX farnesyltransferase, partial [Boseongicola sp. SB0670_bin_30]|nr:protoheme IX farnesyltransferase [Boseongicola sp. SB0670_bin_30]
VMSLVVFTALVGLLVAPVSLHAVEAVAAMLFIAIGAGAAGALNMWYDADIDSIMRRTMKRPVPSGRVAPKEALAIGVGLSGLSVVMLGLATNMLAASLLAVTISYYVVIYTMWLKRRTPQNIVIGGAAGAFPPMIGWAAATGSVSMEACLMFALIFIWTPPHFWALALFMRSDYENAGVPMLTVTHGRPAARRHVLAYALLLVPVSLWIALGPIGGPVSLAASVVLNLMFVWGAVQICRRDETAAQGDGYAAERAFFRASLLYLFLHFGAFLADAVMRQAL